MRKHLQLALLITLLTGAATTHAQIQSPDKLVAPAPKPIQLHHTTATKLDLQWLWQYITPTPDGNEPSLLADKAFPALLRQTLTAPQSFWRDGKLPLYEVAAQYFATPSNFVHAEDNRYISFGGCVPHMCEDQGLIWVDTNLQHPTIVFAATEWTTEGKPISDPDADFNLWLFASRVIDPANIPAALITAIAGWNSIAPQHIKTALIIDPDGTPHQINPTAAGATPSAAGSSKPAPATK